MIMYIIVDNSGNSNLFMNILHCEIMVILRNEPVSL